MNHRILLGLFLLLAGWALHWSFSGLQISYFPPLSVVGPGEFNLWVTYFTLWLPGALLLGGFLQWQGHLLRVSNWIEAHQRLSVAITLLLFTLLFRIGRFFFLRDLPVTDEEYTNQFGGRVLASGSWTAGLNLPFEQMPTLFLINGEGGWTSFDFLGIQLVWALSELTATGPWIFALLSAATILGVYSVLRHVVGHVWALIGTLIFVCSPMATLLSLTTHAHLVSRFFVIWFLFWWLRADFSTRLLPWLGAGLLWGAAMTTRPAESLFLTAPFLIFSLGEVIRGKRSFASIIWFAVGVIPFGVIYVVHNFGVTGSIWLPPRMAPNELTTPHAQLSALAALSDWTTVQRRIIENLLNNIRFTLLYWHGGLGAILVFFGLRHRKLELLLLSGLLFHAAMGLFHDNDGVRVVGPIHFSEWVLYLTILATLGIKRLASTHESLAGTALAALVICGALVTCVSGNSLRHSNAWHQEFFDFIDGQVPAGAVVLAPRNAYFWRAIPTGTYHGSWVFETRSPKPDLSDDRLVLRYTSGVEPWARERFPNRKVFLLLPTAEPPHFGLQLVE